MIKFLLEACVETLEECIYAQHAGADRLELCSHLELDGLTPSLELVRQVLQAVDIPVMVMIRPRGGDFVYTQDELDQMKAEIRQMKALNVAGLVFGALTPEGQIDRAATSRLAQEASPFPVTFHKAIDAAPDPVAALKTLLDIGGIQRVLTSGGAPTAWEGQEDLRQMVASAGGQIQIIAASKVTASNRDQIQQATGAVELHGRRIV